MAKAKSAGRSVKPVGGGAAAPSAMEGHCFSVPVGDLGFCTLVITREPRKGAEVNLAFGYLNFELSKSPLAAAEVAPLKKWKRGWMGLVTTLPIRNGRWRQMGALPGFDRNEWIVPPSRNSMVDESDPVAKWGQYAWGEMWSIETTADEPSMTLVANTAATREEALRVPPLGIFTGASSMEKALVNHFKARTPGFWQSSIEPTEITPMAIAYWRTLAAEIRAVSPQPPAHLRPAGRTADKNLKAGTWLALPVTGGGFGAAMLIEKPAKHFRCFSDAIVMAMKRRWDRWPTLNDVIGLKAEDGCYLSNTSMICVRDGRWRVLGEHPDFDPEHWVWPLPWRQSVDENARGVTKLNLDGSKWIEIQLDPELLTVDPTAGRHMSRMDSYGGFEIEIARILNGTRINPGFSDSDDWSCGIVTPERITAWRRLNAFLRKAVAAKEAASGLDQRA